MNRVHILDCTLRDGGYCNQWDFGYDNIKKITVGLVKAGVDIIECGYLTNKTVYQENSTRFNTLEQVCEIIPEKRNGNLYVAMVNYGEYNIDDLPSCAECSVDGIRLAFHKNDWKTALDISKKIKEKGYKVFVQPMLSICYTDKEFIDLIESVNEIEPYAFYIVDSFGMMKRKDLIRLFYLVEHNLKESVWIGFHSHNNMQLAYSNAQSLVELRTNRNLIVDCSVYGMGRGAGNLNTELFTAYLNENCKAKYELPPLLELIDDPLNYFYQKEYWGYSLPNYISAAHNAHPNYARYLSDKNTLTVEKINEIFTLMDNEKKYIYDRTYIEDLYVRYMEMGKIREEHAAELLERLKGRKIVLIAPGKSSFTQKNEILKKINEEAMVVIAVNFDYKYAAVDYIFLSNLKRYGMLDKNQLRKCIVTSNIPDDDVYMKVRYRDLLNESQFVKDNAGLMAVKFLMLYGVDEIVLAGFDGYSHDMGDNYADVRMTYTTRDGVLDAMNEGMKQVLSQYAKKIRISFLTTPRNVRL